MKVLNKLTRLTRIGVMLLSLSGLLASQQTLAGSEATGAGFERQFSDKVVKGKDWRKSTENKIQDLLDKEAIRDVIYHLMRSLDRMDRGLMRSTYWPEAIEEHQDPEFPVFFTDAEKSPAPATYNSFACQAMAGFSTLRTTQHRVSNILIDLKDENKANVESYVWAFHLVGEGEQAHEVTLFGRMLFNFEKRGDEWRILKRLTVFDWFTKVPATGHFADGYKDRFKGSRDTNQDGNSSEWHDGSDLGRNDPSYEFLQLPSDPEPVAAKKFCQFPLKK